MTRTLLLASTGDEADRIAAFCQRAFPQSTVLHSNWGDPLPRAAEEWEGDLILSYCSRWVVPDALIQRTKLALNFHPGPPEYPGIGGLNWAIYEGKTTFGVTCHHIARVVDSGDIVETRRFPLLDTDNVEELFRRTHLHLECLAYDVMARLYQGQQLGQSGERWSPNARKRKELNAMMTVSGRAGDEEIALRRRAFEFSAWTLNIVD